MKRGMNKGFKKKFHECPKEFKCKIQKKAANQGQWEDYSKPQNM